MDAIKAANAAVTTASIMKLQQPSDPNGFRLALRSPTDFDCEDPELAHDSIFAEAGRRGMARDLAVGLVEYACRAAHDSPKDTRSIYFMRVPIATVADEHFQVDLARAVEALRMNPARICLEVQETRFSEDYSITGLYRLVRRGFLMSLGGFGTGMACYVALKNFPVSYVQVASSFVPELLTDPITRELVRSSIEMAHLTGRRAIAANFESEECLLKLRDLGADYAECYGALPGQLAH